MPKFQVCFRVEQTLEGSIDIEAESVSAARQAFENAVNGQNEEVDTLRREAKLDLMDSEDSITEIQEIK